MTPGVVTETRLCSILRERFFGRSDRYLLETDKARWVHESVTDDVLLDHIIGNKRIGIAADPERTSFGCLDFDGKNGGRGASGALTLAQAVVGIITTFLGPDATLVEVSRSGQGFHVWVLFDKEAAPRLDEVRRFLQAVLRAADLPDDGTEGKGHPGVFPWPPAEKDTGRAPFLPWCGIRVGRPGGVFVDLDGVPFVAQEDALAGVHLITRAQLLDAVARIEEIAPVPPPSAPRPEAPRRHFDGTLSKYAEAALRDEVESVRSAQGGEHGDSRHDALYAAAAALGEFVAGGALPQGLVERELWAACEANGMIGEGREKEVRRTIEDGIRKGEENPRAPEPPRTTRSQVVPEPNRPDTAARVDVEELPEEPEWIREGEGQDDSSTLKLDKARRPAPEVLDLPASCWRFGFRVFRDAWSGSTEAPDAFLWVGYLTAAGLVLGRDAVLSMGMDVYPNIWHVLVGKTGKPRKTTAQNMGARVVRSVDESVIHVPGIGSAEGLLEVFSPFDTQVDPTGKIISQNRVGRRRVLLKLAELSSLLRKCRQEATANLASTLTTLYDCPDEIRLPNRQRPVKAEEPFLAISAGTTQEWLQRDLQPDDVHGGLANRFMIIVGPIKGPLPIPPGPVVSSLNEAERILRHARDSHSVLRRYDLSTEAREVFEAWYAGEYDREYTSPVLSALSARLHTHIAKVALVFAAIEGTKQITGDQMQAAVEFGDYQRKAQAAVFTGYGDSAGLKIEHRIIDVLRRKGPLPGWGIQQAVRHVAAEELNRRINALASLGRIEERRKGRARLWALVGEGS